MTKLLVGPNEFRAGLLTKDPYRVHAEKFAVRGKGEDEFKGTPIDAAEPGTGSSTIRRVGTVDPVADSREGERSRVRRVMMRTCRLAL